MIQRLSLLALMLLATASVAQAGLLEWLQEHRPSAPAKPADKARVQGDDAKLVTLEPKQQELFARVSPDGKHLLVIVEENKKVQLSLRLAENGDPLRVVEDEPLAVESAFWLNAEEVGFLSRRAGGLGLWRMPALHAGIVRRVQQLDGIIVRARLLADGAIIAERWQQLVRGKSKDPFLDLPPQQAQSRIVRIEPTGAERVLSEGFQPALSPDGQWIAFAMRAGRSVHLFLMRTDGRDLAQLTTGRAIDLQPAWSPDGNWIVFTSNRAKPDLRRPGKGAWDLWAISRDGARLLQLTRDPARDGAPSVGPDGWVYFHSDRKVSKQQAAERGLKRAPKGWHIWRVRLPASKASGS